MPKPVTRRRLFVLANARRLELVTRKYAGPGLDAAEAAELTALKRFVGDLAEISFPRDGIVHAEAKARLDAVEARRACVASAAGGARADA